MNETRARATVKDVAARAGVSPKTVSNVLTGTTFVREETRVRVEAAMGELDYVPNFSARSLRNGRSGAIALALPDLATAYASEMSSLFVQVAREHGLAVQFEEFASEPDREWELLSRARAHVIDGLILNAEHARALAESSPSIVTPLNKVIGYEAAAKVAKHAVANKQTVREAVVALGYVERGEVTEEQLDKALDVLSMTRPG